MKKNLHGAFAAHRHGFTLIELLIVIAIIAILASVAVPKFMVYQLKSKSAEGKTNLSGIRTAEETYYSEFGRFVAASPEPAAIPGARATGFDSMGSDFKALGWQPEGNVYFSYGVAINADGSAYTADAGADINANGVVQFWAYAKPQGDGTIVTSRVGCDTNLIVANDVVPCGAASGRSIF